MFGGGGGGGGGEENPYINELNYISSGMLFKQSSYLVIHAIS